MAYELKILGIKFLALLLATPIMGWIMMGCAEIFEKAWKTNNRKKKWLVSCGWFMLLAAIGGWLL